MSRNFAFGGSDKSDDDIQKQFSIDPLDLQKVQAGSRPEPKEESIFDDSDFSLIEDDTDMSLIEDDTLDRIDEISLIDDALDNDSLISDDVSEFDDDLSGLFNSGSDSLIEENEEEFMPPPPPAPVVKQAPAPAPAHAAPVVPAMPAAPAAPAASSPFGSAQDSAFGATLETKTDASSMSILPIKNRKNFVPSAGYAIALRRLSDALIDESSELLLNGPKTIMQKKNGARIKLDIQFANVDEYHMAIEEGILSYVPDILPSENPADNLVEGRLFWDEDKSVPPVVARVHILLPPAAPYAHVTVAKKARKSLTLDDLIQRGSLSPNMAEFIKSLARAQVNILLSGVSGSGKTTLLEAIGKYFDSDERIITIEDTRELNFDNVGDALYLLSQTAKPGEDQSKLVTIDWLVRQANRMRPDRIIVGELRDKETSEFLIAANSGADGSISTVHAANPRRALDKMLLLASKGSSQTNEITVKREIAQTLQIIIQTAMVDGQHIVTHIEEISDTIRETTGQMTSQTLFRYDKSEKRHVAESQPSEQLTTYMEQRGVKYQNSWFM